MAEFEVKDGVGIIPEGTTKIESNLFEKKDKLTSVTIPDSVTEIGERAFAGCTGLTSITIPDSVTEIGVDSFAGCENLKKVTIPYSVTTIKDGAFWCCKSLTEIVIPKSVNKIGHSIVAGCDNLKSIVVEQGNKTYDSRDNCNAIVETATNRLIASCSETTIPTSVTEIGPAAFRAAAHLKEITIPSHVPTRL